MSPKANGHKKAIHFEHPPRRVVSLVPSLTESLFELGMGATLVGITDFCVYPKEAVDPLPRLGGPKNPRVDDILALQPDLVLANQEENTLLVVEALEAAGTAVWVTFPKTVRQALDVLWTLTGLFMNRTAAIRLETLELTLEWAEASLEMRQPWRYFCPVWQDEFEGQPWWMTFNQQTYAHDLLRLMGGENVFAGRERRYPLAADLGLEERGEAAEGSDTRYPRVTLDEIRTADPEVILLPSEPYAFGEEHQIALEVLLPESPAVKKQQVYRVDGSLITWHGTRLARALRELPVLFTAKD